MGRRVYGSGTVTLIALLVVCSSVVVVITTAAPTTYAAVSNLAAVLTVVAGTLLLSAAVVASWWRSPSGLALLALALGTVWFAPVWVGWENGDPAVRSVAMLLTPLGPALLLHLAAALPSGVPRASPLRGAVMAAYAISCAYTIARALVRDPLRDLSCWSNCSVNEFLLSSRPELARGLDSGWLLISAVLAAAAILVTATRLRSTTPLGRRRGWPGLVPVAVAAAGEVALAVMPLVTGPEDPAEPGWAALFVVRALAASAVGLGIWAVVVADRLRIRALARLANKFDGPGKGSHEPVALVLGDPTAHLVLVLPDGRRVDPDGNPVGPHQHPAPTVSIMREGRLLAELRHDPALTDAAELGSRIGPAARLAIDNARLRAATLTQVVELRRSSERVVAAADEARRELERDLHDGAQQRLLALTYELRLAEAGAATTGNELRVSRLAAARQDAQHIISDLREIAHGIYPAILEQAGLDAAVRALAESAPLPVEYAGPATGHAAERPPPATASATERVAYVVIAQAITDVEASGADHLEVGISHRDSVLVVRTSPAPDTIPTHLLDRVGAVGGQIEIRSGTLVVEVPCGS